MMLRRIFVLSLLGFLSVACGSSSDGGGGSGGSAGMGTGGSAGMGTGGAAGGTGKACPNSYGTFVVVGDSISDVGSGTDLGAQQPFYRELLVQNDDAKYPDWQGKDLTACWGSVNVVKVSKGGAKTPDLVGQVQGLPASLPGPVLVVGTIGGNDVQSALPAVLLGQDVSGQLAAFSKDLDDTFAELTKPDRFGRRREGSGADHQRVRSEWRNGQLLVPRRARSAPVCFRRSLPAPRRIHCSNRGTTPWRRKPRSTRRSRSSISTPTSTITR